MLSRPVTNSAFATRGYLLVWALLLCAACGGGAGGPLSIDGSYRGYSFPATDGTLTVEGVPGSGQTFSVLRISDHADLCSFLHAGQFTDANMLELHLGAVDNQGKLVPAFATGIYQGKPGGPGSHFANAYALFGAKCLSVAVPTTVSVTVVELEAGADGPSHLRGTYQLGFDTGDTMSGAFELGAGCAPVLGYRYVFCR